MPQDTTPEEIQAALASNKRALDAGTITQEQYNKRLEELQRSTKTLAQKFDSLASGATEFMGRLKEGKEGISAYNDYIDKGGKALGNFASVLSPALGTMIKAGSAYVQAVNKQTDALYSSYQNISRLGATGSAGITGVYDSMKKFGYGVGQLNEMQNLLQDSASTLASLGGTVAEGSQVFANTAKDIRDSDIGNKFLTMGITVDNMNKGIVGYLRVQTMAGNAQLMTAEQLRDGSAKYIEAADKLTKVTGMQFQQQQAAREQAISEDRFGAYLRVKGREGPAGAAEAEQAQQTNIKLKAVDETLAKAFRDTKAGAITEESKQLLRTSSKAYALIQGGGSEDEIFKALHEDMKGVQTGLDETFRKTGNIGYFSGATMVGIEKLMSGGGKTQENREAAAKKEQDISDKSTKNATEFATSARSARDSMQDLVQRGIEPVTASMAYLADKTAKAAGMPDKVLGKSFGGSNVGHGKGGFLGGSGDTSPTGPVKSTPTSGSSKEYYNKMYNKLYEEAKKQGIANPEAIAKLGAAQTSLETGYGKHMVGNNAFGIKARAGGGGVGAQTQEFVNGKMVTMNQKFRSYGSPEESAADYIAFLKENPRYRDVLAAKTAEEAIAAQGRTGYATDPNYASKLAGINASNAGPSNGRQGVQLPDAAQTVGTKQASENAQNKADAGQDANNQVQTALLASQEQQLTQLERLNRTNKKILARQP